MQQRYLSMIAKEAQILYYKQEVAQAITIKYLIRVYYA